ncbi:hypothetical protein SHIRM173S_09205 [Streptomyces hirsutus]
MLRLQNGTEEQDANSPGGGIEGNVGEIVTPKEVTLTFVGNPQGEVTAMPRLLRIITGDAKSFVNGPANANASWSCTGFEDRQLADKYPLCPQGSDVVRTFDFQAAGTAATSTAPTTVRTWRSWTPRATARPASRPCRSWSSASSTTSTRPA